MLIGRRGQPFFWSPFENAAGNHNVAVVGKSGSGKSVTLQELCASLCGAGARVVVIDDGRSFEHSAKLQGGAFVEFTISRSEEHTSEIQSLMRISYAGFCLKKKKT